MQAESDTVTQRQLPSGRSVTLRFGDGNESLEVRSPLGEVEVRIELTDAGPVVKLRGARLELEAADAVAVRCKQFDVRAEEMRVKTEGDIHLNGGIIRLNC